MLKRCVRMLLVAMLLMMVMAGAVTAQDAIPGADVVFSADGLSAPEALPSGLVTFNYENTAEAPFIGVLLRLNDGVTFDDLMAAMAEDPLGMLPLVSLRGGPAVMPGQSAAMTHSLDLGEYVLVNFAGEVPQMATISVAEEGAADLAEPAADVDVVMVDFGYGLPLSVPAGESVWRIENAGEQWHELAIAPVEPGTTIDDVRTLLAENQEFAANQLPILMPMDSGQVTWLTTTLAPGTYAIICNLPDLMNMEDMHIHYDLGMIQIITVTETTTYVDPAGLFSVDYPAQLTALRPDLARGVGLPFPSIGFADSEATLDLSLSAQPVPTGGWGIAAMFIPAEFFAQMGMPADATLTDRMMFFAPAEDNAEGLTFESIATITLANGSAAVLALGDGITEETATVLTELSDGVYGFFSMVTAVGERTDAQVNHLLALANSASFTGSVEDLLASMSGA